MEGFKFINWAETFSCEPELYFEPQDVAELKKIVDRARREGKRLKVIGSHHSPSDIACTEGFMINLRHITKVLHVDSDKHQAKVEAGIQLKTLNKILPEHGLALRMLGSISEQTISGALSTGTHGTGHKVGIMATNVVDLELLTASGEMIYCSAKENPDLFSAARCGLGALGVIVTVTIQCEPAFKLHDIQTSSTLDDVLDNLDSYVESCDHFRFMWYPHTDYVMMARTSRTKKPATPDPYSWFWDTFVGFYCLEFLFWLSTFCPCMVPWINRTYFKLFMSQPKERVDTSHEIFNFDCLFKQHVTDWAIPRDKTAEVLRELRRRINSGAFYAHMPTEVRFTKPDDIMISPANGRDTCFINIIHFWPYGRQSWNSEYWDVYEDIVRKAGGRPHWAKAHPLRNQDLAKLYPQWAQFCQLRKKLDPAGMFLNDYLERIFSD